MKYRPKTLPRPYQLEALKRAFESNGRYGLFLEPRTGKTKVAVDFIGALWQNRKIKRVLVVCQLSGHSVWEDELQKHCAVPYTLKALPRGTAAKKAVLGSVRRHSDLLIVMVNYESTWRIEKQLMRFKPDVIIFDEGHKIKNRSTKQARCAHRLVDELDPYRLLLTGTPIANKPLDVFSQYWCIDVSVFGKVWSRFSQRYASFHGFYNKEVKYKNLPDLRRRARSRATVLTKEECLTLPPISYEPVYVELKKKSADTYRAMANDFIIQLSEEVYASAAIKLTQMLRLSQITGGFVKTELGYNQQVGSEKLERLEDLLDDLTNADEKVVVFARFRWEIDCIEEICKRNKWPSFKYYGPVKGERMRYPQEFQKSKEACVFIAQTQTGSLSIDLDSAAYCIYYSMDYNLVNWTQSHDRLLANQKRPVTYMYLLARKTIDEEVWATLQAKKEVSTLLHNNSRFFTSLSA